MKCPACDSPMELTAKFCGECGHRMEGSQGVAKLSPIATLVAPGGGAGRLNNPRVAAAQAKAIASAAAAPKSGVAGSPALSPPVRQPLVSLDPNVDTIRTSAPEMGVAARAPLPGSPVAVSVPRAPTPRPVSSPPQAARAPAPRGRPPADIYVGQVLNNRFRVESKIGEGGFGAVYRGEQLATGRKVALKLLHPEMTNDDNLVARFRREGQVLCNLRDAHSITTYDFDATADGTLYIAMELLEGRSLHEVFHAEAPLQWRRVFKILGEMCSSLAEAHAMGIVHRDLKPENIYLEPRPGNAEFVKILDFGIAKVMRGDGSMDPQAPQLTATGQTLGTLEYMSPEQLMGKQLDGRSDVYALGVLGYELITGQLPFPDAKGPAGLITAQLKQTPVAPSVAKPKLGIATEADALLLRCLEKDKNNRFPDVSEMALAISAILAATSEGSSAGTRIPTAEAFSETGPTLRADPSLLPEIQQATGQAHALAGAQKVSFGAQVSREPANGGRTIEDLVIPPAPDRRWIWFVIAIIVFGGIVGTVIGVAL